MDWQTLRLKKSTKAVRADHRRTKLQLMRIESPIPMNRFGASERNRRASFYCLSRGFPEIMPGNSASAPANAPRHSKSCTSHLY